MLSNAYIRLVYRLLALAGFCLLAAASVSAFANEAPCGPNNTIPPGYETCREPNGGLRVGPPAFRPAVIAAPVAVRTVVAYPPGYSAGRTAVPASGRSAWFTIAGITAIAGLITALATLIRAFR
jgi:hypothetical protein